MFELLIVTYFSVKMFKIEIYNHQKFAMWFTLVPCSLKILTIVLSSLGNIDINGKKLPIIYIYQKLLYIPIGILLYIIIIVMRAYVNTKIKWFMDLKYISPSKLLIYYGIMGTIICTSVSTVTTYIKCDLSDYEKKLYNYYICKIPYNGSDIKINSTERYFENFKIYFDTFLGKVNTEHNNIEIIYEIIIIFLGMITFFFHKYFMIKVIQDLTPVYLVLSIPLYYIFQKIILVINNILKKGTFFSNDAIDFIISKFILDFSGDLFSIIGFLIYLEIIELNFCDYNYNIKINITRRSLLESNEINEPEKSGYNDEENHEDEDKQLGQTNEIVFLGHKIEINEETGQVVINDNALTNPTEYFIPQEEEVDDITYPGEPMDNMAEVISADDAVKVITDTLNRVIKHNKSSNKRDKTTGS
jgi:hypothetical protein